MSTPAIDSRVSPALDPETARGLIKGYNDETGPYLTDVISAFTDAYDVLGRLHRAREHAEANPAWTEQQRILMVSKEAERHRERVTRRFDRAHDDLKKRMAHVEGELARPLSQNSADGLAAEVRAHCKSLSRPAREKLLNEALAADDDRTLAAILGGQPFLSGLSRSDHEYFTQAHNEKKQPQLVARLAALKSALGLIYRTGPILFKEFQKAVGASPSVANALDAANERAMAALKIEPAA